MGTGVIGQFLEVGAFPVNAIRTAPLGCLDANSGSTLKARAEVQKNVRDGGGVWRCFGCFADTFITYHM